MKQTASIDIFIEEFFIRAAKVANITDSQYLGYFLNGLKEEIRVRIRSHDSTDLICTMTLTREIEYELSVPFPPPSPSSFPIAHPSQHYGFGHQPSSFQPTWLPNHTSQTSSTPHKPPDKVPAPSRSASSSTTVTPKTLFHLQYSSIPKLSSL